MSTTPIADLISPSALSAEARRSNAPLLICLPTVTADELQSLRDHILTALPGQQIFLATPGATASPDTGDGITLLDYTAAPHTRAGWALTAADFLAAAQLAAEYDAPATLLLGAEAASISPAALQQLADAVLTQKADLALPRYETGPHDALVSSALLYPLTNALFGTPTHLPLPLDAAFSSRMASRLATVARKPTAATPTEPLLWPVAEATIASFTVREVPAGHRTLPHPAETDLNTLLAEVIGSLFTDIEAKATFWQRARATIPAKPNLRPDPSTAEPEDITEMAETFRNAYTNLQEIWALVLPPQSLLGLKKVSRAPAEDFAMPADLWARTVYDFLLAYHLRTINRGHLLGALTPLYLAWVASHLRRSAGDAALAAFHVEETAAAFVAEKPYIVSRWRWPDRFNP